jgi:hypothetical protein
MINAHLQETLRDCHNYTSRGRNVLYWRRRASMLKLEALGLVEQWTPHSMANSRGKARPYILTDAGRAVLAEIDGASACSQ